MERSSREREWTCLSVSIHAGTRTLDTQYLSERRQCLQQLLHFGGGGIMSNLRRGTRMVKGCARCCRSLEASIEIVQPSSDRNTRGCDLGHDWMDGLSRFTIWHENDIALLYQDIRLPLIHKFSYVYQGSLISIDYGCDFSTLSDSLKDRNLIHFPLQLRKCKLKYHRSHLPPLPPQRYNANTRPIVIWVDRGIKHEVTFARYRWVALNGLNA